jgi:hypothetical protein
LANTYTPFGFRQFRHMEGTAPTGGFERLFLASSDTNLYFTGDVVNLSSATTGTNPNTISLWSGSSGYIPVGVFMGCKYYSPSIGRTVWASFFPGSVGSSSPCDAYVCTDTEMLYIAQASTTSGVVGSSLIGFGISIASSGQASGNQTTGISNIGLASSATTLQSATSPFKVFDVYSNWAPPGVNGTSTGSEGGAILVVMPNNWWRDNLQSAST